MDPAVSSMVVAASILTVLLLAGVNIGVCLAISGVAGTMVFTGGGPAGFTMPLIETLETTSAYLLIVIPLFMLMGSLAGASGVTADLFHAFYVWLGRVSGGVAVATIATCAGMAAITGSSVAVAAAMTRIALPQLLRYRYRPELAVGSIAVGGTLAIMIPPSITFVLFGIFAEQSIGKLLIAGILPGLLTAALYALKIVVRCRLDPTLAPAGPRFEWRERWAVLPSVLPFFAIVLAILLGILLGLWTPVESAAGGVLLVLALGLARRRLGFRGLAQAFLEAVGTSASVFLVVIGSLIFGAFLALNGFSEVITRQIVALELSSFWLFCLFVAIYFVLGCFMEITSILALTIPLAMPIVKAIGWDPIWFGVIVVSLMEVAAVTPPVGLNLYAVKAMAPDIPLRVIFKGAVPFWMMNLVVILILYAFPEIALFLPSLM